jgi:hypothetical protein
MKMINQLRRTKFHELYRGSFIYLVALPYMCIAMDIVIRLYFIFSEVTKRNGSHDFEWLAIFSLMMLIVFEIPVALLLVLHYRKRVVRISRMDDTLIFDCVFRKKIIPASSIVEMVEEMHPVWRRVVIYYQEGNRRGKLSMFHDDLKNYVKYRRLLEQVGEIRVASGKGVGDGG